MNDTTGIKKRLLSLQKELQQRLDKTQSEEREEVQERQDTDAQLWEASDIRDGLDDEASNELRQVNIALARLEAGDYGICSNCDEPIDTAIAASERSVELSLDQYDAGQVDYQRVLSSQASLLSQQDSLAQAQGRIASSRVSTYRALGGGWQLHQGQPWVHTETLQVMSERTNWGNLLDDQTEPVHLEPASY